MPRRRDKCVLSSCWPELQSLWPTCLVPYRLTLPPRAFVPCRNRGSLLAVCSRGLLFRFKSKTRPLLLFGSRPESEPEPDVTFAPKSVGNPSSHEVFASLQRLSSPGSDLHQASTPGCAASSGFLNLLTLYSARTLSTLFHAESALGFRAFRGFPRLVATTTLTVDCPSCRQLSSKELHTGSRD